MDVPHAPDDSIEGPHSGSRIKVRGFHFDSTRTASGVLWDDARGVECVPTVAADRTQRCLPRSGGGLLFRDPDCRDPVIAESSGQDPCGPSAPQAYALGEDLFACPPSGMTVYAKGKAVPAPAETYYRTRGRCELSSPMGSETAFFAAQPSPSNDWVKFEVDVTKATDRLGVAYLNGTDGSRVLAGLRLLPENVPCKEVMEDGSSVSLPGGDTTAAAVRCVASNSVALDGAYFKDGTCRDSVGLTLACDPPDIIQGLAQYPQGDAGVPLCSSGPAVPLFRPVAVSSSGVFMLRVTDTSGVDPLSCQPTIYGGFRYFAAGAPVAFADFPAVSIGIGAETGRLRAVWTSAGGRALYAHSARLYDTQAATVCEPEDISRDGRVFCVPPFAIAWANMTQPGLFADPKCTTDLVGVYGPCSPGDPLLAEQVTLAGSCTKTTFRRILGVHVGSTYTSDDPSPISGQAIRCGRQTDVLSVAYDLGGQVDPDALLPLLAPEDL